MADIRDSYQAIQIQVLGQGVAQITSFTANSYKLNPGDAAYINVSLLNNSSNQDTLWCDYYVNGSIYDDWQGVVNPGATVALPEITYVMQNSDATIMIRVGHMVGTNPVQDATQSFIIELWALANILNISTNSPIEAGQTAIITYDVQNLNTQHGGTFWGGLYVDEAGTTPYPGVTETNPWYMTVNAGQTVTGLTASIPNAQETISAYLICGHVE